MSPIQRGFEGITNNFSKRVAPGRHHRLETSMWNKEPVAWLVVMTRSPALQELGLGEGSLFSAPLLANGDLTLAS